MPALKRRPQTKYKTNMEVSASLIKTTQLSDGEISQRTGLKPRSVLLLRRTAQVDKLLLGRTLTNQQISKMTGASHKTVARRRLALNLPNPQRTLLGREEKLERFSAKLLSSTKNPQAIGSAYIRTCAKIQELNKQLGKLSDSRRKASPLLNQLGKLRFRREAIEKAFEALNPRKTLEAFSRLEDQINKTRRDLADPLPLENKSTLRIRLRRLENQRNGLLVTLPGKYRERVA